MVPLLRHNKGSKMANSEIVTKAITSNAIKEPPLFKIIYLNDNQTTVEFVIDTLVSFFDYGTESAIKITEDIHNTGSAVVAVLPYEIAEQKGIEVTNCARSQNMPLQVKLEPDRT